MKKLWLSLPIFLSLATGNAADNVERWGRFELVYHEPTWNNPFREVRLDAVFTSPSGHESRVEGFYDGDGAGGIKGDVFKIRFSPGETGRWSWRTSSSSAKLDGKQGQFECISSERRGPLTYTPDRPHYLHWASGETFFESGPNDPECFLAGGFLTQEQRFKALDYLAAAGCNVLYMGMVNAGPGDGGPEMKATPWTGGFDKPNFEDICLLFMNRLEGVLDHMETLGLVAHLVVYLDDCCEISKAITPDQEERLFHYVVARFGSYPNLVWNLAEEYEECFDSTWCESRSALLHRLDPLQHPVTVHQLSSDRFAFPGSPNFDLTATQYNFTDPDSLNKTVLKLHNQLESAGRALPVSIVEWTPLAPEQAGEARRGIWAIATGGGTYQIFNKRDKEPMSADFAQWQECWRYASILKSVMETLPLDDMAPANRLISRGYCLAALGKVYLAYLPQGGSYTLDVESANETLEATWIDPRTGESSGAGRVKPGKVKFETPTDQDWALLIK